MQQIPQFHSILFTSFCYLWQREKSNRHKPPFYHQRSLRNFTLSAHVLKARSFAERILWVKGLNPSPVSDRIDWIMLGGFPN